MMYEELVKRLRYAASYDERLVIEDCKEAADAIEELSMKLHGDEAAIAGMKREIERMVVAGKPHWIPVTERLPEYRKKVLVFAYGHDVLTARLCKEYEFDYPVFDCNGIYNELAKQGRITHWMPLPELPKEE